MKITNEDNIFIIPSLMNYTKNYIYYVFDKNEDCFIIDPGESEPVIDFLENIRPDLPKPKYIINTHHHWDHVNGNNDLKKRYNLKIICSKTDFHRIPSPDIGLSYDEQLNIGKYNFKIIHTPGHTKNHISLYCEKNLILFCGDVMFSAGCGGIFEGTVDEMFISFQKFSSLPNECKVFTAHEYTVGNLKFASYLEPENNFISNHLLSSIEKIKEGIPAAISSIGIEKKINPFMKFNDKEFQKIILKDSNESFERPESNIDLNVFKKTMKYKENYYN